MTEEAKTTGGSAPTSATGAPELSRDTRDAKPPAFGTGDDDPIAQRRRDRRRDLESIPQPGGEDGDDAPAGVLAEPVHEPASLPGRMVHDQSGYALGRVGDVYAPDGDGEHPMWVTIELKHRHQLRFVPLARIKEVDDVLQVPYSEEHVLQAPEVEPADALAAEQETELCGYYGVGRGDAPPDSTSSYAGQVPERDGPSRRVGSPA